MVWEGVRTGVPPRQRVAHDGGARLGAPGAGATVVTTELRLTLINALLLPGSWTHGCGEGAWGRQVGNRKELRTSGVKAH